MKRILMAAAMLALTSTASLANPCTNVVGDCNANGGNLNHVTQNNSQTNNQTLNNSNKAYGGNSVASGGNGGAGGAGGAGGSASQSQQQSSSNTNSNTATGGAANQSQSSVNNNSNQGNQQNVQLNDRLQAPAVSSFIAASGPCTGVSGGGAVSVAGFGLGMSFASLEEDCKKRELLRIGFASGNPQIGATAAQGWLTMYQAEFGGSSGQTQSSATGQAPAAIAPQQTAEATPAACVGMNTHTNWYANNCPAQ